MKCTLLMTGDELMSGVTTDTNSPWITQQLLEIGIPVDKKITVGDQVEDLVREITQAIGNSDLLIINGGLGPTVDDLTAETVAQASGNGLSLHPLAEEHVMQWCNNRGITPTPANMKQARLPTGCGIIPNRIGSAVGIQLWIGQCLVLCTPGVPNEMMEMFTEEIIPRLKNQFSIRTAPHVRRLQVFGMGESAIQQKINNEFPDWPSEVKLGFRVNFPTLELKLTVYTDKHLPMRNTCEQQLQQMLREVIFGQDNDSIASVVLSELASRHQTLVTAESCTGGLIASMLTATPGASRSYAAGLVTYSNEMKVRLLGVSDETLEKHGAVSEQVVREMLHGALKTASADWGVAVSGIAGPEGGSPEKPVGTIWIAWGTPEATKTGKLYYPAERKNLQVFAATCALDLLRRDLLGTGGMPRYLKNY